MKCVMTQVYTSCIITTRIPYFYYYLLFIIFILIPSETTFHCRNAPRSAKKTNISLADIDDDEIERQALRDHTLGTSRLENQTLIQ